VETFPDGRLAKYREREFYIDNLLVRIHFIIVMIRWTGLAPWDFEFPFQAIGRRDELSKRGTYLSSETESFMASSSETGAVRSAWSSASTCRETMSLKYEPSSEPIHISAK